MVNLSRMGVFMCSPTWTNVWEKQPTSTIWLYRTDKLRTATSLTKALSRITATTEAVGIPSSVDNAVINSLATLPVRVLVSSISRHIFCLISQSSRYLNTTTKASQTWVVPSKIIDRFFPVMSCFNLLSSSLKMKGRNWHRLDESDNENACSSSNSQKLSILLKGVPAFNRAVTTLTLYILVDSGILSPDGCTSELYTCRAWAISMSLFS